MYLVGVSRTFIKNIYSEFGAVKAEVEFSSSFFPAFLSVKAVCINSPSQENPAPAKVNAYFVMWFW